MKDRRKYLLISGIIEYLYIIGSVIFVLMTSKNSDEILATIFINIFTFIFATIMIIYSRKSSEYLTKKRPIIVIGSIILLFSSLISGIFGLLYLRQNKDDKKVPTNKEKTYTTKQKIIALILLIIFSIIMFVLPRFNIINKIPDWSVYLFLFLITITISFNDLVNDMKDYFKNFKKYFPFVIKRYFIMLFFAFCAALIVILITKTNTSNNQALVNEMLKNKALYAFILSVIYAPLIEECVFRLNMKKFINNKTLFIIISGILFGIGHVINTSSSLLEFVPVIQYSTLGICLAKAYSDTNNIMVPISIHFIQNLLSALLVLFVL